jgi:hypothetical protein
MSSDQLSLLANYAQVFSLPLSIFVWLVSPKGLKDFLRKRIWWLLSLVLLVSIVGAARLHWFGWLFISVPLWSVFATILTLLGALLLCLWIAERAKRPPSFLEYRAATIFGVRWSWPYTFGKLLTHTLQPRCPDPSCLCLLDFRRSSGYEALRQVSLVCTRCGFRRDFDHDRQTVLDEVVKEIDRRVNTGEYIKEME